MSNSVSILKHETFYMPISILFFLNQIYKEINIKYKASCDQELMIEHPVNLINLGFLYVKRRRHHIRWYQIKFTNHNKSDWLLTPKCWTCTHNIYPWIVHFHLAQALDSWKETLVLMLLYAIIFPVLNHTW